MGNAEHSYERDKVVQIINSVIQKVSAGADTSQELIFQELKDLKKIIDDARKDLGAAGAGDIKDKHIPTATDELEAVVGATAEATGTIMDAGDVIMEKAGEVGGDVGDVLMNEATKIFEACSFQDITGQRITKVVKTLQAIDEKVSSLMNVLGVSIPSANDDTDTSGEEGAASGDAALLKGPQMPGQGVTQDDIDQLLAEFDE